MSTATRDPVFVIDDDPAARDSVAALVRSHGLEVETYESAEDFLSRFDRNSAGCLVVDVRMTGMSGIDLQAQLVAEGVELPVIVITGYGDVPTAVRAMKNGAVMFLEKPCSDQRLWASISEALGRESASRAERFRRAEIRRCLTTLTPGEARVLDQLIAGHPNKSIAKELDIGLRTVELRRAIILQKLNAGSLAELVRMVLSVRRAETIQESASPGLPP